MKHIQTRYIKAAREVEWNMALFCFYTCFLNAFSKIPLDIIRLAAQLPCCTCGHVGIVHPHFLKQSAILWTQTFQMCPDP